MKFPSSTAVKGTSAAVAAIIAAVFALEKGFVDKPADPGGATNHGITQAVAVQHGYTGKMENLPKEVAEGIYYVDYVKKPGFELIAEVSAPVAEKVVDAGVNTGVYHSSVWFQTSLNALNRGGKDYPLINVDGKVGAQSVAAYKGLQKARGNVRACELVLKLMDAQQAAYYVSLKRLPMFTVGWVDHRIGNVPISRCAKE